MALAVCPKGDLVVTAGLNVSKPQVWDLSKGEAVGELAGHTKQVMGVCVSADGKLVLTAGHDNTVRV